MNHGRSLACALLVGVIALGAGPPAWAGAASGLSLPPLDRNLLLAEDAARDALDGGKGRPLQFAVPIKVDLSPESAGSWELLPDGGRRWQLLVTAPEATCLTFGFDRFVLPKGGSLRIVDAASAGAVAETLAGPWDNETVDQGGELWTPIVPGEEVLLELNLPPGSPKGSWDLHLRQVGQGYRDVFGRLNEPLDPLREWCEIDVECPEGDAWRDQIRAVGLLQVEGVLWCSGSMLIDVPRTFRSWYLTAEHCTVDDGNDNTVVVYWNHQSSRCDGPEDGHYDDAQLGATWRAGSGVTDFTLLELNGTPDPAWDVYYTGWDRSGQRPSGSVCVHHPNVEEKSISFNYEPLTSRSNCIVGGGPNNTHWEVAGWDDGSTEGGSSGSGLLDPVSQLLVGTLSGGGAACGGAEFDCYGKFSVSWDDGGRADERLQDWLDPDQNGPEQVSGSDLVTSEENCGDGIDDEGDGATDCEDPDCAMDPLCLPESDCGNGLDDDSDGATDCEDSDCAMDPRCLPESDCGNGADDDLDGATDCEDSDCAMDPRCLPESDCGNGADDDLDGATDCEDSDCAMDPRCLPESDCGNGADDDLDGTTDCEDSDCAMDPRCLPESDCGNGADDDLDGATDCDDSDCAMDVRCVPEPDCGNGIDDDLDGATDCDDSDCTSDPLCLPESDCADGMDNDGDGATDCEDEDCVADALLDCDGDGRANGDDCLPADSGVFAEPLEWSLRADEPSEDVASLSWSDPRPAAGSATLVDVVSGNLQDLHQDRGFAVAACLVAGSALLVESDARPTVPGGAFYYLIRAWNACGGSHGRPELDGVPPCP